MLVLDELSRANTDLSVVRKPFERYSSSGEINTHVDDPPAVLERVAAAYAGQPIDRLDGLTVDCGPWWFNLRPSNTEPLLRLNLEAPNARRVRPARRRAARPDHRIASRPMSLDPRLLAVLACPEDKGPLYYLGDDGGLYNPRLHRRYEVRDGIPVMLIDEAVAVDDAEHEAIMAEGRPPTASSRHSPDGRRRRHVGRPRL